MFCRLLLSRWRGPIHWTCLHRKAYSKWHLKDWQWALERRVSQRAKQVNKASFSIERLVTYIFCVSKCFSKFSSKKVDCYRHDDERERCWARGVARHFLISCASRLTDFKHMVPYYLWTQSSKFKYSSLRRFWPSLRSSFCVVNKIALLKGMQPKIIFECYWCPFCKMRDECSWRKLVKKGWTKDGITFGRDVKTETSF